MRTFFCVILALGIAGAAHPLAAQQTEEAARIGWLWGGRTSPQGIEIVRSELEKLGWFEGRNIVFEHRVAQGDYTLLPGFAAELVAMGVRVILAVQSPSTVAAKEATRTIPIVMVGNGDPVRYGLVTNLARPEANVTGVSFLVNEMAAKLVGLLKEAYPGLTRLAVFTNPANPGAATYGDGARIAARTLRVETVPIEVRQPGDFDAAFESVLAAKADALLLPPEGLIASQRKRLADFAARNGLVAAGNHRAFAAAGALMSYATTRAEIAERVAVYVDRLLRGAEPGDLPVEQPTRFKLVVNLKTARALGLTVPPDLLALADEVLE